MYLELAKIACGRKKKFKPDILTSDANKNALNKLFYLFFTV
jgi:hypothetical protein